MFKNLKEGKSPSIVLILMLIFGLVLIFIPILFTNYSLLSLDYKNTGEIGDIIGGITSPFLGFVGIILTFYAFWIQYQANIFQRNDIKFERFENKYYELLRLHRDNVEEMKISNNIEGEDALLQCLKNLNLFFILLKTKLLLINR